MKVELLPHKAVCLGTGKAVQFSQYRVVVDDVLVAYKAWKHGSKICFVGQVSPLDREEIEIQVQGILGDSAGSVLPPEADIVNEMKDEEQYHDDFNEDVSA